MSFGELVTVAEFPEELAGERVGWADVRRYDSDDYEPVYVADIVTATVGEDGAVLSHYVREEDGELRSAAGRDNSIGFTALSGLSVLFSRAFERLDAGHVDYAGSDTPQTIGDQHTLLRGAGKFIKHMPRVEDISWVEGSDAVRAGLIEGLKSHELEDYYPLIYYLYNLHTAFPLKTAYIEDTAFTQKKLLPDPEMIPSTRSQIDVVRKIDINLHRINSIDEIMAELIDQHGSSQLPKLADRFASDRRHVAANERKVIEIKDELVVPYFGYLPVGFRPNGRSWPYMNPLAIDENEAFGLELDALKDKSRIKPVRELDREMQELFYRIEHVSKTIAALALLATAETLAQAKLATQ